MEIKGFDEMRRKLEELAKNAKELDGEHNISLSEILTPLFISGHTKFANIDEMFETSGFKIESQEDFEAIPEEEMDKFIRSISSFPTWKEMLNSATGEWAKRKLGL